MATITTWFINQHNTGSAATIGKAKQSPYLPVYSKEPSFLNYGKTNFSHLRGKTGVYFIKENGKIVYIGSSSLLYKRILRHFQDGRRDLNANYYTRFDNKKYTVSYILFNDYDKAFKEEQRLIKKHSPRDNEMGKDEDTTQENYTDGVDYDFETAAPF